MSYILDALRRAETERDRGQVPGLNAQPATVSAAVSAAPPLPVARWLALVGGLTLLAALLAWWLWPREVGLPPVAVNAAAGPTAPAVPATPVRSAAPVTPAPEPTPAPAPVTLPIVVSAPTPPPLAAPAAVVPPAMPPATPPAAVPKPAPAAADPRTVALAALTPEQRRDWPPLAIGGAVYSDSPASRFVIVGGQLVREGDAAAPGITVERIGPRSVLLRWRDLRVEVPF